MKPSPDNASPNTETAQSKEIILVNALDRLRCYATTGMAVGVLILLAQTPARADCGKSAFAYLAPKAGAVEKMPITNASVLQGTSGFLALPPRQQAVMNLPWVIGICPDEPRATDIALSNLAALWKSALAGQNEAFVVQAIGAGRTTTDTRCTPIQKAYERSELATDWSRITSAQNYEFDPATKNEYFAALKRGPQYEHILALFAAAARRADVALPPIDDTPADWAQPYQQGLVTAQAHAPAGVLNCVVVTNPARK
jgi:hypothetical protein